MHPVIKKILKLGGQVLRKLMYYVNVRMNYYDKRRLDLVQETGLQSGPGSLDLRCSGDTGNAEQKYSEKACPRRSRLSQRGDEVRE